MQLKTIRLKDINRAIIENLNINSFPVKFAQLQKIVFKYVDILILTETKLDDSFPTYQFMVDGFSMPYQQDKNRNGGGIMIYIRDKNRSKLLTKHFDPPSQSDSFRFEHLDIALDIYSNYEKVLLTGDFNSEITEPCMDFFLYQHDMDSLVKEKTCFKSITKLYFKNRTETSLKTFKRQKKLL